MAALTTLLTAMAALPASAQRVATATRDLLRGTVLTASDFAWSSDTGAARSKVAPGWIVRRTIHTGEVLQPPSVEQPDLVSPGDMVDVMYIDAGVTVKLRGTAIGRGGEGDEVYVKLDTRHRIRGIVAGAHTVRIQ